MANGSPTPIIEVTQLVPPPNCPAWTFFWVVDPMPPLGPAHPTTGRPTVDRDHVNFVAEFSGIRQLPPGGVLTSARVIGLAQALPVDPFASCVDRWNVPQPGYTETVTLLWQNDGQDLSHLQQVTVEVQGWVGANQHTFSFPLARV